MTIFVSPAEPLVLKTVGTSSIIPEKYGADFYWVTADEQSVGVQRKEVKDLVNSLHNGLLAKEIAKMNQLDIRILLIEGNWRWNTGGTSSTVNGWSLTHLRGVIFSMHSQGFWVLHTDHKEGTIESLLQLKNYLDKPTHSLIRNRPKATSSWGKADNRDWGIHILQSFDGVAVGTAEAIYDHFEGVPLCWTVTKDEMKEVKGVGPKRVESLTEALPTIDEIAL